MQETLVGQLGVATRGASLELRPAELVQRRVDLGAMRETKRLATEAMPSPDCPASMRRSSPRS
jgi:hypothetical protein